MLSDSLELLHFLYQHAADKNIIEPAVEHLDAFTDKWRDGTYRLLSKESVDIEKLQSALKTALGSSPNFVEFVSLKQLSAEPLKRQHRFFRIAHGGNLTSLLRTAPQHAKMYSTIRNIQTDGRRLYDLVKLSLGARTLQKALDSAFGNSFSSVLKNDFIELWYCRFGYVILGEFAEAEKLDPLIAISRTNPLFARLQEKPHTQLLWED